MSDKVDRFSMFSFGEEFGNEFSVLEEIGRGAFGAVLKAKQKSLKRHVAVKYLLPQKLEKKIKRRFKREAQILCSLSHPNVVDVYSFGFDGEAPYLVQELLQGRSLEEAFHAKRQPTVEELVEIGAQVASALAYIHAEKVVHRDLKPANIFVCKNGKAKLIDFGLARGSEFDTVLTATGCITGTPLFLAPEQLRDNEVRSASDIYSLGLVLYEGLSGQVPFQGLKLHDLFNAKISVSPPLLNSVAPDLPRELCSLIDSMVALEIDERPEASAVEKELKRLAKEGLVSQTETVEVVSVAELTPPQKEKADYRYLGLGSVVILLFLLSFFFQKEKLKLDIQVDDVAKTSLELTAKTNLLANVTIKVKDRETKTAIKRLELRGKGREWKVTLTRLPADRELIVAARALKEKCAPITKGVAIRTLKPVPKLLAAFPPFEQIEGPGISSEFYCFQTKKFDVVAVELKTGKELWRLKEKGPLCDVCACEDAVFCTQYSGLIKARRWSDGKLLWRHDFSTRVADPKCYRNVLIVKDPLNCLIGFDTKTGKKLWRVNNFVRGQFNVVKGRLFVCSTLGVIMGIDPFNGKVEHWKIVTGRLTTESCSAGDYLCFAANNFVPAQDYCLYIAKDKKHLHRLASPARYSVIVGDEKHCYAYSGDLKKVVVFDVESGKLLWGVGTATKFAGLYALNDCLYIADEETIRCFNPLNGKLLWSIPQRIVFNLAPVHYKGDLVWWTKDGKMWKMAVK